MGSPSNKYYLPLTATSLDQIIVLDQQLKTGVVTVELRIIVARRNDCKEILSIDPDPGEKPVRLGLESEAKRTIILCAWDCASLLIFFLDTL